jgi:hypothetical protein
LQVQLLSLPLTDTDELPGAQPVSKTGAEGSTPSVRADDVSVAEQQRHHRAKVVQAGATPAGHSLRPVTQRVWRPACRAGETGSSPVQGADDRAEPERRGDRLIRGGRQVRLLPARLTGEWTGGGSSGVS